MTSVPDLQSDELQLILTSSSDDEIFPPSLDLSLFPAHKANASRNPDYPDTWDLSKVKKAATLHYKVEEPTPGNTDHDALRDNYKPGLIAKTAMSSFGWKDKSSFYDDESCDLPYCISSASGFVAKTAPVYINLVWESAPFSNLACPQVLESVFLVPSLLCFHPVTIGGMPMIDVARLADLMTMCQSGVKIQSAVLSRDDEFCYLLVISTDPRMDILFNSFKGLKCRMPLRFTLGRISANDDFQSWSHLESVLDKSKLRLLLTNVQTLEKTSVSTLVSEHLESSNPLFDPSEVGSAAPTKNMISQPMVKPAPTVPPRPAIKKKGA